MPPTATTSPPARAHVADAIIARAAVAVVRLPDTRRALAAVRAIADGGVTAIELTMTTPGALDLLEDLARGPDAGLLLGAGTVLDAGAARRAVDAGAAFVVSPVFSRDVLDEGHRLGVPVLPGAFTPTEIYAAHAAGADLVKLFPADTLGPAHVRGVLAPMPFLRLMPTGGVTPDNVGEWLRAGAVAVGLGSSLVDPTLVAAGDTAALTARARRVAAAVAEARG
ncbi:2-dehydro-3-deoxy-phosphogluconate aldolase [Gemmatimonadetes bacterium T265]|nr:2-dehydro-3-deoxy-phosphogluconate aldolase [Gemmatimonadetes bacterium T265]